jgi:hypothetical protein
MPRLNHFDMERKAAQYVFPAPDKARTCGGCSRREDKPQWVRCGKGGFFVGNNGTCKHFSPRGPTT